MANKRIINIPVGGLDVDSENRMVDFKDYRYALNIRNGIAYLNKQGGTTNVKGNKKIVKTIYSYTKTAPLGTNKCLGTYEDKQNNTLLFFMYNSNGAHQIMRYFPEKIDANNPYGEIHQLCVFNFGWKSWTKITSVDLVAGHLLYWTDNIHSRKLNIDKAELVDKHKSWTVHYPLTNQFASTGTTFITYTQNGVQRGRSLTTFAPFATTAEGVEDIANNFNNFFNGVLKFEACKCKLSITEVGTDITDVTISGFGAQINTENFYGYTFIERYVNVVKYPPTFNPTAIYRKDTKKNYNYVRNRVFQFRLQYVYDDHEKSALSPISQIASGNTSVNTAQANSLNYIDVDFNNTDIVDVKNWVLIKWVRLFVIEHNTGKWRQIADLEPCDFYDIVNGKVTIHYKFFNDVDSKGVDDALAAKLYDDVPIENQCQKFVKNRLVMAGVTQNYDAPECVDATILQEFENAQQDVYNITAKIRIFNPTYNVDYNTGNLTIPKDITCASLDLTDKKQIKGAIVKHPKVENQFDYPVFGGISTSHNSDQEFGSTFNTNQGTDFEQWLPEGGFVGYLAGTDFLGISVQEKTNGSSPSVIGQAKAFDASDMLTTKTWIAGKPYSIPNPNSALVQLMTDDSADVYSLLTIKNVPNGTYVLRLASHWCSYPNAGDTKDKLDKGSMYNLNNRRAIQKTSTNVTAVKNTAGTIITNEFELVVTVNNGDVYAGEFFVSDQTSCFNFAKNTIYRPRDENFSGYRCSIAANGYLVDNDGKYSDSDLKVAIAMEKQYIDTWIMADIKSIPALKDLVIGIKTRVATDHNGYYNSVQRVDWNWFKDNIPPIVFPVTNPTSASTLEFINFRVATKKAYGFNVGGTQILLNSLTVFHSASVLRDIFNGGLIPETITSPQQGFTAVGNNSQTQFLVPCVLPSASAQLKTYIYGNVIDNNGDGFAGITTVYTGTGRIGTSDNDGQWEIPIYAESTGVHTTAQARADNIIYYLNGILATFNTNNTPNIIIGIGTVYTTQFTSWTNNKWFQTFFNPVICTVSTAILGKTHKRGGNYIYALRYYDYGGRLCSVVSAPNLNFYIPFITEDLNRYFPNQYPSGTYLHGKPKLTWTLNSKPPIWAYTYQWMRTKDNHYQKYLSWVINAVKYVSKIYEDVDNPETETLYSNGDATNIMLDISNLADYKRRNPSSSLAYEFQAGDRVRLIRDQDGVYYNGLIEYEVVSFQTTGSYLILKNDIGAPEIKAGTQIEVYHTRDLEDEKGQIFYEVGECFACTNPDRSNNDHSVTTAVFTNSDTYWKNREILVNDSANTKFTGTYNYAFEDASISDFYESKDSDIGRIGTINKDFVRQFRPTLHVLSNVFIPDTQVNGLSNFESLNSKELDRNYGLVERLMYAGDTMFSICHNKVVSNYIGERVIAEARDNVGIVAIADDFFGTDRAQLTDFGCQHPESVIQQDNSVYGVDVYRGLVWRHAQNGSVEISAINNRAYFKNAFIDGVFDATAGLDRFYNEYILTIYRSIFAGANTILKRGKNVYLNFTTLPPVSVGEEIDVTYYDASTQTTKTVRTYVLQISGNDIIIPLFDGLRSLDSYTFSNASIRYKGEGETISWSEEKNRWVTFYSYTPEKYGIIGMNFVSFVNGEAWLHDVNDIRNNFYGNQYKTKITPIFVGEDTSTKKVWEVAKLEQYQADQKCNWSAPIITNDYNQLSRLAQTFVKKEEHWSNPFKRDLSDVTVPINTRILNGRMLRSTSLTVGYENDYTDVFTLRALVAEYIVSLAY